MTSILWCCHVRGPDDVWAAPDYDTALKWSDICLELDRRPNRPENFPFLSAVPAPWPYSAESWARSLEEVTTKEFSPVLPKEVREHD